MKKQKLLKSTVSLVLAGILAFQGPLSECALAEPQAKRYATIIMEKWKNDKRLVEHMNFA